MTSVECTAGDLAATTVNAPARFSRGTGIRGERDTGDTITARDGIPETWAELCHLRCGSIDSALSDHALGSNTCLTSLDSDSAGGTNGTKREGR